MHRDGVDGVFVRAGNNAKWQPIELGLRNRDAVQVTQDLVRAMRLSRR